jgi:UPF0716 protein FxsA
MLRTTILAMIVVEATLLVLVAVCAGWWLPVVESVAAALLGLSVIFYTLKVYDEAFSARLDGDVCLDDRLANGSWLLIAGSLLVIPGFLTDIVGLALLVPAIRHVAMLAQRQANGRPRVAPSFRRELPDA